MNPALNDWADRTVRRDVIGYDLIHDVLGSRPREEVGIPITAGGHEIIFGDLVG